MEININDNVRIGEIQEAFNKHFHHLKLEFFVFKKGEEIVYSMANMLKDSTMKVNQIGEIASDGTISINANQKVSNLENDFHEKFGIHVQVFRRSGKNWLETSSTDSWTLDKQNSVGEQTAGTKAESTTPDFDAYHEQL